MRTAIRWLLVHGDSEEEAEIIVLDTLPASVLASRALPLIHDYVECKGTLYEVKKRQWSWFPNGDASLTILISPVVVPDD